MHTDELGWGLSSGIRRSVLFHKHVLRFITKLDGNCKRLVICVKTEDMHERIKATRTMAGGANDSSRFVNQTVGMCAIRVMPDVLSSYLLIHN